MLTVDKNCITSVKLFNSTEKQVRYSLGVTQLCVAAGAQDADQTENFDSFHAMPTCHIIP